MKVIMKKILLLRSKQHHSFEITVSGTSMLPILHPGDTIKISAKDDYLIGDILVFFYKDDNLLVHRLLKVENNIYYCKGDNSFRIEDIKKDSIVGAVNHLSDVNNNMDFVSDSYFIGRLFKQNDYDSEKTKSSVEYKAY